MSSIIMPPPAPTNPQIRPITVPHRIDWITRVFLSTAIIVSFVVMTGFTINLMPSSIVITVEKPPIAFPDTKLDR